MQRQDTPRLSGIELTDVLVGRMPCTGIARFLFLEDQSAKGMAAARPSQWQLIEMSLRPQKELQLVKLY